MVAGISGVNSPRIIASIYGPIVDGSVRAREGVFAEAFTIFISITDLASFLESCYLILTTKHRVHMQIYIPRTHAMVEFGAVILVSEEAFCSAITRQGDVAVTLGEAIGLTRRQGEGEVDVDVGR